jgi:hypothetical protein
MITTMKRIAVSALIVVGGGVLVTGTAYAVEINDDADLDTSVVTDLRGCTHPDPKICNWSDEKYEAALRRQEEARKREIERSAQNEAPGNR